MKALIIGGGGLIGSSLENKLSKNDYETMVLDNFTSSSMNNLKVNGRILTASSCSLSSLQRAFSSFNPDIVFHFADLINNQEGVYNFKKEADVCVQTATNILRCIEVNPIKHLFLGSSAEVYYSKSKRPLKETSPVGLHSYTGSTKLYTENLFRLSSARYNFSFSSLRFFHIYGKRFFLNPKFDLLTFFVNSIIKNIGLVIVGPDLYVDVLDVKDAVEAVYLTLNAVISGETVDSINIGSGEAIKVQSLYNTLCDVILNERVPTYKVPPKAQSRSLVADISLLESMGWNPTRTIQDELPDLISFFRSI